MFFVVVVVVVVVVIIIIIVVLLFRPVYSHFLIFSFRNAVLSERSYRVTYIKVAG